MILRFEPYKWRHQTFLTTGLALVFTGHDTTDQMTLGKMPRLPMIPGTQMEKTWLEYFRTMHKIIENHLADYQMHKVK